MIAHLTVKTKLRLTILFSFFIAFSVNAQPTFNAENVVDFQSGEIKSNDIFNYYVKSAIEDTFVLDSNIIVYYKRNYNDSIRYYYSYDNNGKLVEKMNYCNTEASIPINYRYQYSYDEKNRGVVSINYKLDLDTYQWQIYGKIETSYHANGNKVENFRFLYDTTTNDWNLLQKDEIFYDENGKEISNTKFQLNDTSVWYPKEKTEFTYDEQGRYISLVWYQWDDKNNKLEYNTKQIQEYDDNGNHQIIKTFYYDLVNKKWNEAAFEETFFDEGKAIKLIKYDWNENQWVYSVKIEITYNSDWNQTSFTTSDWDIDKNEWIGVQKSEYSYYSNGLINQVSSFKIDTTGRWIGNSKTNYLYSETGNEISTIESAWNIEENDWKFVSKAEKEYNLNQQVINDLSYSWNDAGEEWLFKRKKTFEYDFYGHNTKVSDYGFRNETWELDIKEEYFYTQLTTNTDIISQTQTFKLYPNPANEVLTIETQNQKITYGKLYDLNGKLMKNLTIQQGVNLFNISDLKSGVYVIQIPQKAGMMTEKLVKN